MNPNLTPQHRKTAALHGFFLPGGDMHLRAGGEAILETEVVYPAEHREWRPEHELAKEVLLLTFSDLRSGSVKKHTEARRWFDDTRRRGPFTLHGICETLGLDPTKVQGQAAREAAMPPRPKRRGRYVNSSSRTLQKSEKRAQR